MLLAYKVVTLFAAVFLPSGQTRPDNNPDIELKTPELVVKYGYSMEIHSVITEDGYILEMHRISRGGIENGNVLPKGIPVLLQHGFSGSSADWVIMGPKKSLAYILADEGYDVWLGNNRGNVYSRNHTKISPNDREFWDFSWHELGMYDLPAMIDHVVERTYQKNIFFIGHSQGTTQFFVMTSERPDYNSKIKLMVALAPAAFTSHMRGPVMKLTTLTYIGVWTGEKFGYPEYTPRSKWAKYLSNLLCQQAAPTQFLCGNLFFLLAGFSFEEQNSLIMPVIIGHIPAGASWKQLIHYGQGAVNPGHFRRFDYANDVKNILFYNLTSPPDYPLEEVSAPVALFNCKNDYLATPEDVELLRMNLRNVVLNYTVPSESFSHYDFVCGMHAKELIYNPILHLLQENV